MERIVKLIENKYLLPSLELVQEVFAKYDSLEEGKAVRQFSGRNESEIILHA